MTSPAASRRKGAAAEIAWCDWLNGQGRTAVRVRLNGVDDLGDVHEYRDFGLSANASTVIVYEVKSTTRLDLPGALRELDREVENVRRVKPTGQVVGALVIRPRGVTDPALWPVIQRAQEWKP